MSTTDSNEIPFCNGNFYQNVTGISPGRRGGGGMVQTPVETLQAEPLEPSAEVASVNVVLDPYLW